jgi:hypothetical protein
MGHLTITALKDNAATHKVAAEQRSLPPVSAAVQINTQTYLFAIAGARPQHIDIPTIALRLEEIVAMQASLYALPQQMMFSGEGLTFPPLIATGSALALYNFFKQVLENKTSNIGILIINDQVKPYQAGYWVNGGLEFLKDIFPQLQAMHLPHLIKLHTLVVPNSSNITFGLADVLKRGGFNGLTTLELPYSAKLQPYINDKGWICLHNVYLNKDGEAEDILGLKALYCKGFKNDKNFTKLKHLRLTLWTEQVTVEGLATLSRLYSRLKTLAIDSVMPTAKQENKRNDKIDQSVEATYSSSIINYIQSYWENTPEVKTLIIPEGDDLLALDSIIKDNAHNNKLENLEIYHWHPGHHYPVFAHEKLQEYLAHDWLPKLNSITMRPAVDRPFLDKELINPVTAMDTAGLLATLIEKQTPITTLQLLMPEKTGYQTWLTQMAAGGFPLLTHLSYRLPDQWIDESEESYHDRIGQALHTIHTAILEGQVSALEACIIEGTPPSRLEYMVPQIDNIISTRRLLRSLKGKLFME